MTLATNRVAAVASLCLVLAACGGAGDEPTSRTDTDLASAAAPADTVQLEGCVLDLAGQPRQARVQALDDDGRLLASAGSDERGVFVLRVPARRPLTLSLDTPGQERLPLLTGSTNVSLTGCLSERGPA
jgi:hypothetical protein